MGLQRVEAWLWHWDHIRSVSSVQKGWLWCGASAALAEDQEQSPGLILMNESLYIICSYKRERQMIEETATLTVSAGSL